MNFSSRSLSSDSFAFSNDLLLARFIRYRRQQMGLTLKHTAKLAGLSSQQWAAVENGWVPEHGSTQLFAIAGALEVNTRSLLQLADISRTKAA